MTPSRSSNDAFKALANELRLRLFYALGAAGEATATHLAKETGLTPALVSYHLTKLGEFGLIEEVHTPDRDQRERWWRLREGGVTVDDDTTEGGRALRYAVMTHHVNRLQDFLESDSPRPPEATGDGDQPLAFSADMVVQLTGEQAAEFQGKVRDLLQAYARQPVGATASRTLVMVQGIPFHS